MCFCAVLSVNSSISNGSSTVTSERFKLHRINRYLYDNLHDRGISLVYNAGASAQSTSTNVLIIFGCECAAFLYEDSIEEM